MRKIFVFEKPEEDDFAEFNSRSPRPSVGESIGSSLDYMGEAISSFWHPTVG